jgi:hypothetical protein
MLEVTHRTGIRRDNVENAAGGHVAHRAPRLQDRERAQETRRIEGGEGCGWLRH